MHSWNSSFLEKQSISMQGSDMEGKLVLRLSQTCVTLEGHCLKERPINSDPVSGDLVTGVAPR